MQDWFVVFYPANFPRISDWFQSVLRKSPIVVHLADKAIAITKNLLSQEVVNKVQNQIIMKLSSTYATDSSCFAKKILKTFSCFLPIIIAKL